MGGESGSSPGTQQGFPGEVMSEDKSLRLSRSCAGNKGIGRGELLSDKGERTRKGTGLLGLVSDSTKGTEQRGWLVRKPAGETGGWG